MIPNRRLFFFKLSLPARGPQETHLIQETTGQKIQHLFFLVGKKKKRERLREREKKGYICYNHGEEIRTVPTASFPTFFVTKNKPLLFLQQSPSYYLAIQRKKTHNNFNRDTCLSEVCGHWNTRVCTHFCVSEVLILILINP